MSRLRIGLIGAGSMGALHARVVAGSENAELAWVADPNDLGRRVADRFGSVWIPEPDFATVDAVIVATPTHLHHRVALDVIAAGLPMLLVCASERRFPTSPCDEARKFARHAAALQVAMQVQPEPLDHGAINKDLGLASAYTHSVGAWIDRIAGMR